MASPAPAIDSAEAEKPLLAYAVTEDFEGMGGVVFARSNIEARKWGASEYNDGELGGLTCKRAPWADCYANEPDIPISAMVDAGWHFECHGCGRRIDTDLAYEYDDGIDEPETTDAALRYKGWTPDSIIGTQRTVCFCDARCETEHNAHEAERKRRQDRTIARFEAIIRRRFPDATFPNDGDRYRAKPHAYATIQKGKWHVGQVIVPFEFPGQTIAPAELRYDPDQSWRRERKPYYTCCNGDREAFEAYAASTKRVAG